MISIHLTHNPNQWALFYIYIQIKHITCLGNDDHPFSESIKLKASMHDPEYFSIGGGVSVGYSSKQGGSKAYFC